MTFQSQKFASACSESLLWFTAASDLAEKLSKEQGINQKLREELETRRTGRKPARTLPSEA